MANDLRVALERFFAQAEFPILFTGAGISARAGLPPWGKYVEQLGYDVKTKDPLTGQQILECFAENDLTKAIDYFRMSSKILDGDKLKMLVNPFKNYDHQKIVSVARLPFKAVLTTNFDRSIFDAMSVAGRRSPMDFKYGDTSFKNAQWEEAIFVARIHGCVENPSSIILSKTDFSRLLKDADYENLLRACFLRRNVLFMGFSFYDPAIRHIFEEMHSRFGESSPGRHMALLPSDASSEFINTAHSLNIEVVKYDSRNFHEALWGGIDEFLKIDNAKLESPNRRKSSPFDSTKNYLAACYARAKTHERSIPLRVAVVEGIVSALLQEAAPDALSQVEILERIRKVLGLRGNDVKSVFSDAIRALVEEGLCRRLKGGGNLSARFAWNGDVSPGGSLDDGVRSLAKSVSDRAYLQEGWRTGKEVEASLCAFFNELVRRRGWDLGAAFAAGRAPETVVFSQVLSDASLGLTAFDIERLTRILEKMFQHPSEEESEVLAQLGKISFALEIAFQRPQSILVHKVTLPKKIYFDASVLMPAYVEGHPLAKLYSAAIKRLTAAATSASISFKRCVCHVYLNEIISHRRLAVEYSNNLGQDFLSIARADATYHGVPNVNVYVGAYANWIHNNYEIPFQEFLDRFAPYKTEAELSKWLKGKGFEVVTGRKERTYSQFYPRLEIAHAAALGRGKDPILVEHDAIQLSMLEAEISKGERSLFVTADKRLQGVTAADSAFADVSEMLISHVGLIQFIDLLVGGVFDASGITELLWSSRISDRSHSVRAYLTSLGLDQYDAGLSLAMPKIIETHTDIMMSELSRQGHDPESRDPKRRADAFRTLGSLEKNYLAAMRDEAERIRTGA